MTLKERYAGVIAWFEEHMPVAESEPCVRLAV